MPRASQSRESAIVSYFKTAELAVAQVVLKLASEEVKARQQKSTQARARSLQAAPAAVATPKAAKKKAAKTRPARKPAPAAPAVDGATEAELNGD